MHYMFEDLHDGSIQHLALLHQVDQPVEPVQLALQLVVEGSQLFRPQRALACRLIIWRHDNLQLTSILQLLK